MKRLLESLGIYSVDDLIATIGGVSVLLFVVELMAFIWLDHTYTEVMLKLLSSTAIVIFICWILDGSTKKY